MQTPEFKKGLSCGLVLAGLSFGNGNSGGSGLPNALDLRIVNCDVYRGAIGDCVAYLKADTYTTVFSNESYYVPTSGIVAIGKWTLMDWETFGDDPLAVIKIEIDGEVAYEGDIYEYFNYYATYENDLREMKAFSYTRSFIISAKRLNLSDGMCLELYNTVIISTEKM